MLIVPRAPRSLVLPIERGWDGTGCEDPRLHASLALQQVDAGLRLSAWVPDPAPIRVPRAPAGSRVGDLWHYDVAECFLVGGDGGYLEVELGAGGHFLVLSFDAPRRRSNDHEDLRPVLHHQRDATGWRASILLPGEIVPERLRALNAFVSARGRLLAYEPVPGDTPDFHQPGSFPRAQLAD